MHMKKLMVILLGLMSWQANAMFDLASSFLGITKPEPQQAPKQAVHVQQKIEPVVLPSTGGPITVNLNLNIEPHMIQNAANSANSQSESNAQATATAQAEAYTEVNVKVSQLWDAHRESMQTFLHDNKLYLGASALAALYSYYCYQVICGNLYLQRTDLWSSWKNDLSFDQLCAIPQQTLARELILSIQHQGLDTQKPTDFVVPLVTFLQVIEEERKTLLYYQTLHSRITTVKCARLFPFNKKRYNRIEERLQRLSFVKNIFISWMAEFNLEHAKKSQTKQIIAI